jgi:hypothetical protein
MEGFQKELISRLPLAESVWVLFRHVADPTMLNDLFDRNRGRCYEDTLTFDTLVSLVSDALLVHGGSGRQSFEKARAEDRLDVSNVCAYGKLRRLPTAVSEALLGETSDQLRKVFPPVPVRPLPSCFAAFQVLHIDGKKIKQLAKRLKPLRGIAGSMLGGKALVALAGDTGIALAMAATEDGEANDAPLVPPLVQRVRLHLLGRILWIADRQFCDLKIPHLLSQNGDAFVIRYSLKMKFHPDETRKVREFRDDQGRTIREEWGWIGGPKDVRRMYVRRLTLIRPGEEPVIVLTNLLDAKLYPAVDVLRVYQERWQIERAFQEVTEVFQLQRLIGSTPKAAVFQASFCLVLYNLIHTIRSYVAEQQNTEAELISTELLFRDVTKQMICWSELGETPIPECVMDIPNKPASIRRRLKELLRNEWSDIWWKSPPKDNWKPPKHTPVPGGHSSAWKLLQEHKKSRAESGP